MQCSVCTVVEKFMQALLLLEGFAFLVYACMYACMYVWFHYFVKESWGILPGNYCPG